MHDVRTATLLFPLCLLACLDPEPPSTDDVDTTAQAVNVPVVWQSAVKVQVTGASSNTLRKNVATSVWDAGAVSQQTLGGTGWVRFATSEANLAKTLGLSRVSTGNSGESRGDIDYGLFLTGSGGIVLWENGAAGATVGSYVAGDTFYIEATPTQIVYRKGSLTSAPLGATPITNDHGFFPVQVDTSIRDQNATLVNVVVNEDPEIHVAVQNDLFDDPADPLRCGVGDTITLGGYLFLPVETGVCGDEDFSGFADGDPLEVKADIVQLAQNKGIDRNRADIIVTLDLEHPGADDIWGCVSNGVEVFHTTAEKANIVRGLKNRIIGTRLAFPNAKLSLFPSLVTNAWGTWSTRFQAQVDAIEAATDAPEGLFDDLAWDPAWGATPAECPAGVCRGVDYFTPVLFTRFGCDGAGAPCDQDWGSATVTEYTNQAIDASAEIGSGLPLLPYLGFWVAGSSPFDKTLIRDLGVGSEAALDATLRVSMQLLEDAGVDDVVLWAGGESTQTLLYQDEDPETEWKVDDYTCWL